MSLHVVPIDDWIEHDLTPECWCHPTQDNIEHDLWVHHAADGRERDEPGETRQLVRH